MLKTNYLQSVKKTAKNAQLNLTTQQLKNIEKGFKSIINYMADVKDLNTDQVSETSRVTEEINVWREDQVKKSLTQNETLANAHQSYQGYFLVPYILKGKK